MSAATDDMLELLRAARAAEEHFTTLQAALIDVIGTLREANSTYRLGSRAIRRAKPDSISRSLAAVRDLIDRLELAIAAISPAEGNA